MKREKCPECGLSDYMHNGNAAGWCDWNPNSELPEACCQGTLENMCPECEALIFQI